MRRDSAHRVAVRNSAPVAMAMVSVLRIVVRDSVSRETARVSAREIIMVREDVFRIMVRSSVPREMTVVTEETNSLIMADSVLREDRIAAEKTEMPSEHHW